MKLPAAKSERIKIYILIGLGTISVISVLHMRVVSPLIGKAKARREELTRLTEDINRTKRSIAQTITDRAESLQLIATLLNISQSQGHILHGRLGNYRLGALDVLDPIFQRHAIPLDTLREVGVSEIPKANWKLNENSIRCYTARVTFECGLFDLLDLLGDLEESNPCLSMSSISISAQSLSPQRHKIGIDLQWPIWVDPNAPDRLVSETAEEHTISADQKNAPGKEGAR